jgi:UDP-GlcNAc:undecaprenyl-phosphate GlcNAc-1-phosphate transferase
MPLLSAFLIATGLTVLFVPLVGAVARRYGLVARPSQQRWHEHTVPNIGGVAMAIAFAGTSWVTGLWHPLWPALTAALLMFLVGVIDDLTPMRPSTKLVMQIAIAAVFLYLVPPVITGISIVDTILGFLWIVGITNAFNLLDNIDGLAAGVAAIAGAFFLIVFRADAAVTLAPMTVLMVAFVGVAFGFLLFNFHPAAIFMGDGGSHLLGCVLATAPLLAAPAMQRGVVSVVVIPVVLLLIPIFDTSFVTLTRGLSGRSAFIGGRDHTSHRLVALGIGERRAVLVLYALAIAGGYVAVALKMLSPIIAWALVLSYIVVLGAIGIYLGHIEATKNEGEFALAPLPSEITTRYRAYEVVLDAVLVSAAYYLALLARFREPQVHQFLPYFTQSLPLVVVLQVSALWVTGKYRQVWRTVGPWEMLSLFRGACLGVGASVLAMVYLYRFIGYSRLVFFFDALFAPTLLIGMRVVLSGVDQYLRLRRSRGRMALIYGAGRGGALAVRELLQNTTLELTPVGFLDDDRRKRRLKIDGLPILGAIDDLAAVLDRHDGKIATVVVAITDLATEKFAQIREICAARNVSVRWMRFMLEDVVLQEPARGVVAFRRPDRRPPPRA